MYELDIVKKQKKKKELDTVLLSNAFMNSPIALVLDETNIYQGLKTVEQGIKLGFRYIKKENDSYWFEHREESNKAVIIITDGEWYIVLGSYS